MSLLIYCDVLQLLIGNNYLASTGGSGTSVRGAHGEREPAMMVWGLGLCPQRCQGQKPWSVEVRG